MAPRLTSARQTLESYSALQRADADVYAPGDVDELSAVLALARSQGRRVTFRCGGHIFDDQSLNDDVVVSMRRFDSIHVDRARREMTVGAGATWGAILDRLEPLGLVPYVTVTTRHASAGGTLAGDCLSRFSPTYGKEGVHIKSFELVTPSGERIVCTEPPGEMPRTREERLFNGVIGGLGYLGAVTSITYRLLDVGQTNGRIGVASTIHKFTSFDHLVRELVPRARKMHLAAHGTAERRVMDVEGEREALYAALFTDHSREYAVVVHSHYTSRPERRRFLLHRPNHPLIPITHWAMRIPFLNRALWRLYFALLADGERFIDDVAGYLFFMDGNYRAKKLGRQLAFAKMQTIQQTFVIPADVDAHHDDWERTSRSRVLTFVRAATKRMQKDGLVPTMLDVLFLPRDERFLLSASAETAGFAVSFAFETSDEARLRKITACFEDLSDVCHEQFQGRVYLVKNVRARPATLAKMYARSLDEFFALKREVDPDNLLRNDFLERNFGVQLLPRVRALEPALSTAPPALLRDVV